MTSTSIGNVDETKLDDYLRTNADRAEWLFLPEGDPRLGGSAGAGGHDDPVRGQAFDLIERNPIVADDADIERIVDLSQPLHEVVGERIVIVDQEDGNEFSDRSGRVLRGGSFYFRAPGVRSAFRVEFRPSDRVDYFGLRVARTYPSPQPPPRFGEREPLSPPSLPGKGGRGG